MDLLFSTASTILGSPDSNQSASALSPEPSLANVRQLEYLKCMMYINSILKKQKSKPLIVRNITNIQLFVQLQGNEKSLKRKRNSEK